MLSHLTKHLLQSIVPVVRGLYLAVVGDGLVLQGLVPRLYQAEHLVAVQLVQQHHHVSALSLVTISLSPSPPRFVSHSQLRTRETRDPGYEVVTCNAQQYSPLPLYCAQTQIKYFNAGKDKVYKNEESITISLFYPIITNWKITKGKSLRPPTRGAGDTSSD